MVPLLSITDLSIAIQGKSIVKKLSLEIQEGEVHAIMGPNGSGKSTLVQTLMGHPAYEVTNGSVLFRGKNLLPMSPDERAHEGLFLAFQYPREITGVSLRSFLHAARNAQHANRPEKLPKMSPVQFQKHLTNLMKELSMDSSFAERSVNEGFSGGEKKKAEVLQVRVLQPSLALLDETDSGLDIDALQTVAKGIAAMRSPDFSALIVTHYARILQYLRPDRVHVMVDGRITKSGGYELAEQLEKEGYGSRKIPLKRKN